MATVQLDRVSKRYSVQSDSSRRDATRQDSDSAAAVDEISLSVDDQELMVLVGPSGCGKSTTLRLIAGLETCDSGEVRIGGRRVNDVPAKDRDIAMVFQNYALYPHMSVYKNLSFGLELRFGGGFGARVLRRIFRPARAAELAVLRRGVSHRVQQAARRLGIDHLLTRRPHELSGGERQRVALGRAIVRNPAAFLFDEPLSNLDAQLRTGMRSEIRRLQQELRATMIYVTHDQV
jgi:multiple sugar transport system ATP-binding protein